MDALVVDRVDDRPVMDLWRSSPHATIFTRPDVLRRFFGDVHWWGAHRKGRLLAAWPVPLDATGRPMRSGWFYFVGPIWDGSAFPPAAHRALTGTLPIYTAFIDALVATYGGFVASLPPPQTDVRAFTWWRHDEGAPIQVRPRYSARLGSLSSRSFEDVLAGMRQLRRRELRRDLPVGSLEWSAFVEPEELAAIYLERVPGEASDVLSNAQRLIELVDAGAGFASVARAEDRELAAVIVVLSDGAMANVVVNSVAESWRPSGVSVHNMVRVLAHAQRLGHDRFDFNGANSPARGDDKHSYGAEPILYFDVSFSETEGALL